MGRLSGRYALVTGASRGIGRAIALALGAEGAAIGINYRTGADLALKVAEEIKALGARTLLLPGDVSKRETWSAMLEQVKSEWGQLDILVNNAGITRDGLAMRMKPEDWRLVLEINLNGAFFTTQQILPGMLRERWGRIINIASVVGQMGNPGQANYVTSKAGIIGLTKALAQEVVSRGITANAVAPGYIETDMTARLPQEAKDRLLSIVALRRPGQPEDVANAVNFLASDDASYITGHVVNVNGGMYM
jgi:3-oxoacyl-[acyl-carrier protein] reductase